MISLLYPIKTIKTIKNKRSSIKKISWPNDIPTCDRENENTQRDRDQTEVYLERHRTSSRDRTERNIVIVNRDRHTVRETEKCRKKDNKILHRKPTDTQNRDRLGGVGLGQKTRQLEIDRDYNRMRETY